MHQDAWLLLTGRPSCCGNVMETPESFQIQGTMATVLCGGQLLAFPAESVNISRDKMWCRFPSISTSQG